MVKSVMRHEPKTLGNFKMKYIVTEEELLEIQLLSADEIVHDFKAWYEDCPIPGSHANTLEVLKWLDKHQEKIRKYIDRKTDRVYVEIPTKTAAVIEEFNTFLTNYKGS
jgi:hypothetical protein